MRFSLKKALLALVAAPAVLAYIDQPCTPGANLQGVCVKKSQCVMQKGQAGSAKTYKGFCKNDPADVLCCVKKVTKLTNGNTLANAGTCKNVSQCPSASNILYSNQCPGSSNVRLCVPKGSNPPPKKQYEIIDVSQWNEITDYAAAAKKIQGVIMRCGYRGYGSAGTLAQDKSLNKHYNGFKGRTKIGYYFLSQAITTAEAVTEANYVVNTLLKGKQNNFPIYLDSEWSNNNHNGRADGLSKKARTDITIAFINRIKALKYKAGVYASQSWFNDKLDFKRITATGASIWVAKYSNDKPTTSTYDMWQYTDKGSISGIKGNVDRSHVYKNLAGW